MSEIVLHLLSSQNVTHSFAALSIVPRNPSHTQTLPCVLPMFVCICVFVAPSQKEDLIASVMAGEIIATHSLSRKNESVHFCLTVLLRFTHSEGYKLLHTHLEF